MNLEKNAREEQRLSLSHRESSSTMGTPERSSSLPNLCSGKTEATLFFVSGRIKPCPSWVTKVAHAMAHDLGPQNIKGLGGQAGSCPGGCGLEW